MITCPINTLKRKVGNFKSLRYKVTNWAEYNQALSNRGDIEFWINDTAIDQWYEKERVYDGIGTAKKFSDDSIIICHEIRQVYKLPLRQCEGFINSIFNLMELPIECLDYSCLSKRLSILGIFSPHYKKSDKADKSVAAIAIDSTGLKCFGYDKWHQEKHNIITKRSWRKLHIAVDIDHIIHGCELTDRFVSDDSIVCDLLRQIDVNVKQITADGAYDKKPTYKELTDLLPEAEIIIPLYIDVVYSNQSHPQRNRKLQEIKTFGRINWQRARGYGNRNYSELCIQRYKRILGNKMHAREISRQKNEAMIGCGVLNKMTSLGMSVSYRAV